MSKTKRYAWHFVDMRDGKPVMRDGAALPPRGRWLRYSGDVAICRSGLHASVRAGDALGYAPGDYITRVEIDGIVTEQADKLVCSARKVVWGFDATAVLRKFARNQALSVLDQWSSPVPEVVRTYLETGDEAIRSAAWSAARSAAWSAAWFAARSAARYAAGSAARYAAWSAAWSAHLERANELLEGVFFDEAKRLGFKGGR